MNVIELDGPKATAIFFFFSRILKLIAVDNRPCEQFHGGTIKFQYHCAEGSVHLLVRERLANPANISSAEVDTINVCKHEDDVHASLWAVGRCSAVERK